MSFARIDPRPWALVAALFPACAGENTNAQLDAANATVSEYCACVLQALAQSPDGAAKACQSESLAADQAWEALPQHSGERPVQISKARAQCDARAGVESP